MNLRICFKIAKEAEMAMDQKGNLQEAFVRINVSGTDKCTDKLVRTNINVLGDILGVDTELITQITEDEYQRETKEGRSVQFQIERKA